MFNDFQELPDTDMSTEQIADKAEVPVPCVSCERIGNSRACLEPVVEYNLPQPSQGLAREIDARRAQVKRRRLHGTAESQAIIRRMALPFVVDSQCMACREQNCERSKDVRSALHSCPGEREREG
eukprot:scpid95283/ scgid2008/ 